SLACSCTRTTNCPALLSRLSGGSLAFGGSLPSTRRDFRAWPLGRFLAFRDFSSGWFLLGHARSLPSTHQVDNGALANLLGDRSPRISLLFEGVPVDVVAVLFPEPGQFAVDQFDTAHPLHALPRVQVRHDEAQRITMLGSEWFAVVAEGENCRRAQEIYERQVRSVALLG